MRYFKWMFAAGAAASFVTAPAAAQQTPVDATPPATGRAVILVPLTLTRLQDLNFGGVVPSGVAGSVTIDPATGARTVSNVAGVPSDVGGRATFGGAGSPNQGVNLTLIQPAGGTIANLAGDTITVSLVLESPTATVDATTRSFFVGVGGTANIAANQAEGSYTGTFELQAVYQ